MERPRLYRISSSSSNRRRSTSRKYRRRLSSSSGQRPTSTDYSSAASANEEAIDSSADAFVLNEVKAMLDNTLPMDYFKQDILSVIQALRIPKWRKIQPTPENISLMELRRISGALTNSVYKLTFKNYYPLLLRLYGDNLDQIIDRAKELLVLQRLSQKNIGPKLLGCFTNGRFEEFLNNSITLNKEQIRDPKISRMIARRMKELHFGIPLLSEEKIRGSKVWNLIEKWVQIVDKFAQEATIEEQKIACLVDWNSFKSLVFKYREWLHGKYGGRINIDEHLKFCHNDTQYGNLLFYSKHDQLPMNEDDENDEDELTEQTRKMSLTSSGQGTLPLVTDLNYQHDKKLVVIDFEYAGPNIPAYDITNHFCEWMYDYHHPTLSHMIRDNKYPSREERLNLLNSYVNYAPGSQTPYLQPSKPSTTSASTVSIPTLSLGRSASIINIKETELPPKVVKLYNETIMWRATNSVFWALWGFITVGTLHQKPIKQSLQNDTLIEVGPNGETYRITVEEDVDMGEGEEDGNDVEEITDDNDDNFDYLEYSSQRIGIVLGDLLQLGLIDKDGLDENALSRVKFLDSELLKLN